MDTQTPERIERLVAKAQLWAAICGNADATSFELFSSERPVAEFAREITERGLHYYGAVGLIDGRVRVELESPLENEAIDGLASAFVQYILAVLRARVAAKPPSTDPDVQWCRALIANPPRYDA